MRKYVDGNERKSVDSRKKVILIKKGVNTTTQLNYKNIQHFTLPLAVKLFLDHWTVKKFISN